MVLIFDPKGKSDREIMAFCQSFMTELCKYIGADVDVPAGDISEQAQEKSDSCSVSIRESVECSKVFLQVKDSATVDPLHVQKLQVMVYYTLQNELWKDNGMSLEGKTAAVSGSGNVAIYAIQKAQQLGAKGCNMLRFYRLGL